MDKQLQFPIYRKLSNEKSYYKIVSLDLLEEVQLMGHTHNHFTIHATQYPEKLMILDMIDLAFPYVESTEAEFKVYFE